MDIFCHFKKNFPDQIIKETKSFYLIHDGFPLVKGHLMIIPKKHYSRFSDLEADKKKEFMKLKKEAASFLERNYTRPVFFEHGGIIQTIPHAHFHLLPTNKSVLKKLLKVAKIIKKVRKNYLYYGENNVDYYFYPVKKLIPGFFHREFAKALGRPLIGLERGRDLKLWLSKFKRKWTNG